MPNPHTSVGTGATYSSSDSYFNLIRDLIRIRLNTSCVGQAEVLPTLLGFPPITHRYLLPNHPFTSDVHHMFNSRCPWFFLPVIPLTPQLLYHSFFLGAHTKILSDPHLLYYYSSPGAHTRILSNPHLLYYYYYSRSTYQDIIQSKATVRISL